MIDGYSSLPPKPPPVSAWMTTAWLSVERERALERRVDVVRALHRAVDGDAAVGAGHGDHRVVLDVQLLLVADAVLALDDEVGRGAAPRRRRRCRSRTSEHVGRLERVEDGRQRLRARADRAACASRSVARSGRGEQRHRLGVVADLVERTSDRLVVVDER